MLPAKSTVRLWILAFAAGCAIKAMLAAASLDYHLLGRIDPLDAIGRHFAIYVSDIGSPPGTGWDMAIPPLASQIVFWVVFVGVFGFEMALGVCLVRWSWVRLRKIRRR